MIVTVSLTQEMPGESDEHLAHSVAFGTIDSRTVTVEQFKQAVYDAMRKINADGLQKGWVL